MMKKILLLLVLAGLAFFEMSAQRMTDKLDRGLVAVKVQNGIYCSWRIYGEEYYDVTYNIYRDGVKIAENLTTSNYTDSQGTNNSQYTIAAVVRGKEQSHSKTVLPFQNNYLEVIPKHDNSITSTLVPNDACCADVDGDGQLEILLKYDNKEEINNKEIGDHNMEETWVQVVLDLMEEWVLMEDLDLMEDLNLMEDLDLMEILDLMEDLDLMEILDLMVNKEDINHNKEDINHNKEDINPNKECINNNQNLLMNIL